MATKFAVTAKNPKQLDLAFKSAHNFGIKCYAELHFDVKHKAYYTIYVTTTKEQFEIFERHYKNLIS